MQIGAFFRHCTLLDNYRSAIHNIADRDYPARMTILYAMSGRINVTPAIPLHRRRRLANA
ncbi:hypothetical protein BN1221_04778 [Brenneria goodwinii]|uniref:Uncharacterized protein n=1 Tax=Brenneria goodwinii TaxID=1109412 RepID=A0A0G4K2V9_9GAMM|nr:hypothetical protein BN1221_04778 [Brenneria goodwinii]